MTKVLTLKVAMLGASGTGKTSTIAALYDYLVKRLPEQLGDQDDGQLVFTAAPETGRRLDEYCEKLFSATQTFVSDGGDIPNTSEWIDYEISGNWNGERFLNLVFVDYPGGDIARDAKRQKRVQKLIRESDIVALTLDTILIRYGDTTSIHGDNMYERVVEILVESMPRSKRRKLLMVIPIKCESFGDDLIAPGTPGQERPSPGNPVAQDGVPTIPAEIQERLGEALESFRPSAERLAVVLAPVQTLGSVRLSYLKRGPDGVRYPVFETVMRGGARPSVGSALHHIISFALCYEASGIGARIRRMLMMNSRFIKNERLRRVLRSIPTDPAGSASHLADEILQGDLVVCAGKEAVREERQAIYVREVSRD